MSCWFKKKNYVIPKQNVASSQDSGDFFSKARSSRRTLKSKKLKAVLEVSSVYSDGSSSAGTIISSDNKSSQKILQRPNIIGSQTFSVDQTSTVEKLSSVDQVSSIDQVSAVNQMPYVG